MVSDTYFHIVCVTYMIFLPACLPAYVRGSLGTGFVLAEMGVKVGGWGCKSRYSDIVGFNRRS